MKIRKYKSRDAKEVARVISNTFASFNNKEGTKKAVNRYITNYSPKKDVKELHKSFERTPIHFVALDKNKVIGIIRGNKNRVVNLFILGDYHGKGIGKDLLNIFEKEIKKYGSKLIKIRSSLYAVNFYESQGYKKTTGIRNFMGLKIQPMIKRF